MHICRAITLSEALDGKGLSVAQMPSLADLDRRMSYTQILDVGIWRGIEAALLMAETTLRGYEHYEGKFATAIVACVDGKVFSTQEDTYRLTHRNVRVPEYDRVVIQDIRFVAGRVVCEVRSRDDSSHSAILEEVTDPLRNIKIRWPDVLEFPEGFKHLLPW